MWEPLNETVFVKMDEIKTSHLVPEHLKENMAELRTGIVVSVGTGTLMAYQQRQPLQVKRGDRVLFGAKVGKEIPVGDEKLLLLAEPNILAVEKEEWTN
jgi:chaperonin GroES